MPEKQAETHGHALTLVIDNNLATKQDLKELELRLELKIAESKADIIKWCVVSIFASVGLFATIIKLLG